MRRLVLTTVVLLAGTAALLGAQSGEGGRYRVDAVFDRTAALIPGQEVKVAGTKAGLVQDIELTSDRKARVEMEVEPDFAPFRADARCTIRQDALIGEKFVQCDPGTPRARPLRARGGRAPTVSLERTTVPVEVDLILATFRLPYRDRLRILLNEFGAGLAGRSQDLDATIRRSNPALREVRDVLGVLDRDRETLGQLVEGTDAALAELAGRRREVQGFIERADVVTQATASRRGQLSEAIRRLPPLLDELEPSAERFGAFSRQALPAARSLREAAPAVNALLGDLEPLSDAAVPALERLGRTSRIGRRATKAALPVARRLQLAARELPDVVRTATVTVESLRENSFVEGLLSFLYYATSATARYDVVGHILPSFQVTGACAQYATEPVPGCSAHYAGGRAAAAGQARQSRQARRRSAPRRVPGAPTRPPAATGPGPGSPPGRGRRELLPGIPLPGLPESPAAPGPTGIPVLDYLLGP